MRATKTLLVIVVFFLLWKTGILSLLFIIAMAILNTIAGLFIAVLLIVGLLLLIFGNP